MATVNSFRYNGRRWSIAVVAAQLAAGAALAQSNGFSGKWMLELDYGRVVDYGILEIETAGDSIDVYIDGGRVNLHELTGDRIAFDMDWTDGGDRLRVTELEGRLDSNGFGGTLSERGEPTGSWRATRWAEHADTGAPPRPVDISGIWVSISRGTHKDRFTLSATGEAINDAYDASLDDPHLRCVSGGAIRMEDGPMPYEIIQRDNDILILYEYFHEVRRIWMDGRDFPDGIEDAYLSMGYSIGHWEGSTLVVETRGMRPTLWDASGMPVSTSAVVIERKYLDDDGRLHTDYTLNDAENYLRPVYRHAYREQRESAVINESACDPHSFYRSLDLDDRLEEYWPRSNTRF